MLNKKFKVLIYGFIWLCLEIRINCIIVEIKEENTKNHRLHSKINKNDKIVSFEYEKDYYMKSDEKISKEFDNMHSTEGKESLSKLLFNEINHPNTSFNTNDIDNPYYISYGRDTFGSSTLWNSQTRPSSGNVNSNSILNIENNNFSGNLREKRGVTHLYNMVGCATGCNPLSYKGYGCYCGFLGSGLVTDPIDRCCMIHDLCYSSARCPVFTTYVTPYLWRCWNGFPQCALDHTAFGGPNSCSSQLCQCDKELALCLSNWPCPQRRALCKSSPWRLLQNILLPSFVLN